MSALRAEWIDAIGREHVLEVARALGLEVQPPRGASGGSCVCPACGAQRRHPSRRDPRLAIGVRAEGRGWRCYQCDASGDQLHLVAIALEGRRFDELAVERKSRVRAWVIEWLRLGESPSSTPARPRLELPAEVAPVYPPPREVRALWGSCVPVVQDERIVQWLARDRGLRPSAVRAADICRVLPYGAPCPAWATRRVTRADGEEDVPWSRTAYRALFGLYDASGALRSLIARFAGKPTSDRALKSRAPRGHSRKGLVLADRAGHALLEGRTDGIATVVIAEGEMDVLAWSTSSSRRADQAVLGVVNGSWTAELAARVPDGVTAVIATHADKDGDKYAATIVATLADRIRSGALRAERWRP